MSIRVAYIIFAKGFVEVCICFTLHFSRCFSCL